jgi:hypothetical protein
MNKGEAKPVREYLFAKGPLRSAMIAILMNLVLVSNAAAQYSPLFDSLYSCVLINKPPLARQGFSLLALLMPNGAIGYYPSSRCWDMTDSNQTLPSLEYPPGSGIDKLQGANGLWVGGRMSFPDGITRSVVSTVFGEASTDAGSFHFGETGRDTSRGDGTWITRVGTPYEPGRRGFDDDADGRIDEDELDGLDNDGDWLINRDDLNHNGKPDHGEPNVDEDYGAVSDRDMYISFRDSLPFPRIPFHTPMSIKIFSKSYAWKDMVKQPIIFFEYYITNEWLHDIESVYVGFFSTIASFGPRQTLSNLFLSDVRTVAAFNGSGASTPIGVTFLGSSIPLDRLTLTYVRFTQPAVAYPFTDAERYRIMSSGIIDTSHRYDEGASILLSVGPLGHLNRGDTLKFAIAFVAGDFLSVLPNNVHDNAATAIEIYNRNYLPPMIPPSPPLKLTPVEDGVRLDWKWEAGDPGFDPLETWDDSNKIVNALPDTHWRRRNPPAGKMAGGRIFEGFRLWRSEYPVFEESQFGLIHQFDVADDLNFEGQTGLAFSFVDSTILRGKRYFYAVTSITIPDKIYLSFERPGGGLGIDTTLTAPTESPMHENVLHYSVPFMPSTKPGQVKVVPNPYRTDQNYIFEQGGWEGLGSRWTENRRVVWFIHLPSRCTIRIFSLAGEIIKSISHDDSDRQSRNLAVGQEEFELLSESNRALASGIYIYLVESDLGTQTGKFVIIR